MEFKIIKNRNRKVGDILKGATKTLIQLLNSGKFLTAELYTFELISGQKIYFTSYDVPLNYNNNVYQPALLKRTMTTQRVGLMVDSMNVTCNFDSNDKVNDISMVQAFVAGTFDNSFLTLERVFMPTDRPLDTSAGAIYKFSGRVDVDYAGRKTVELIVKSVAELFNVKIPRNCWMPTCQHSVYDSSCCLAKDKFTFKSTIETGTTKNIINSDLTQPDDYFNYGVLVFTTGINVNVRTSVKKYSKGTLLLTRSLPYTPNVGDNFYVYAGCDGVLNTCKNKFSNVTNFRGFPFVPRPETIL